MATAHLARLRDGWASLEQQSPQLDLKVLVLALEHSQDLFCKPRLSRTLRQPAAIADEPAICRLA